MVASMKGLVVAVTTDTPLQLKQEVEQVNHLDLQRQTQVNILRL
jgi:hypothetical protein